MADWHKFADTDPFYALLGEVQDHKVFTPENAVETSRLEDYCGRVLGWNRKPKDWVQLWASMLIPVEIQADVLEVILRCAIRRKTENLGNIIFELLKGMRVKVPAAQAAIKTAYAGATETHGVLQQVLFLIYPKSPQASWGWARVGWGWQMWWQVVETTLRAPESTVGFDELAALLERIESESGESLAAQELWTNDRLAKARKLLCTLGGIDDEGDLLACLDATLQ
jgi:hypothetical protein